MTPAFRGATVVADASLSSAAAAFRRLAPLPRPEGVAPAGEGRYLRTRRTLLALGVVVAAAVGGRLPVPYYSVSGGLRSVNGSITVTGAQRYPTRGQLWFPVVTVQRATVSSTFRQWFGGEGVSSRRDVVLQGDDATRLRETERQQMEAAKQAARLVALRVLPITVVVDIDSAHLGGPSAGLAYALGILDVLTPGELTGGHIVVVTGALDADGKVTPVGGVAQKAAAAARAGADLLIVPCANHDAAIAAAGTTVVVCTDSFLAAVELLVDHGGEPVTLRP